MQTNPQVDSEKPVLNKAHIQRQFDRSAMRYDRVAKMQLDITRDLMAFASTDSNASLTVLDAGCGTGYGLLALKGAYPKASLMGLDLAPAMLEVAKGRCPQANYYLGDIEQLPFQSDSFGLTWSSSAIQWCDLSIAAKELSRVTKSGGQILVSTFSNGTLQEWRNLWCLTDVDSRFESIESIAKAFGQAGLTKVRLETRTYIQEFTSFNEAVKSIRDLGAGNAEHDRSRGLFGVEQYKKIKSKVDAMITLYGSLKLPYVVTFVVADKE